MDREQVTRARDRREKAIKARDRVVIRVVDRREKAVKARDRKEKAIRDKDLRMVTDLAAKVEVITEEIVISLDREDKSPVVLHPVLRI